MDCGVIWEDHTFRFQKIGWRGKTNVDVCAFGHGVPHPYVPT